MLDAAVPADLASRATAVLDTLEQTYAAGDASSGELLLVQALDDGLPWDQVCAAAARGIALRFGEHDGAEHDGA